MWSVSLPNSAVGLVVAAFLTIIVNNQKINIFWSMVGFSVIFPLVLHSAYFFG